MRPTHLSQFLARALTARLPILITGCPGIGKTDIVSQACDAANYDLIKSFPSVEDPTEPGGYPWIANDHSHAVKVLFGQAYRAVHAERPTVWFLDDIGQATPATQAGYMQWLLAGEMNGHRLPEYVTMIAATNRRTDRAGVSGILEPVKSRFAAIVELEPNLDDWCQWAFTAGVPAELIAFLRFRPDLLCKFTPSADLTNCPLPRTWSHVAKLLAINLPSSIQHAAITGAVGEGAAVEFGAFLRLYAELPNIDGILLDPDGAKIPTQPATLYAVVTALGMKANPQTFPRLARYAERLTDAQHGEFAALLLRDAVRKDKGVMQTAAFVKLASGDLGQLIAGGAQ